MLELTIRLVVSLAIVVGLLLLLARFGSRKFRGFGTSAAMSRPCAPTSDATGLISNAFVRVKLLLKGDVTKKVTVKLQGASAGAIAAVEKAGGSFEKISLQARPASTRKQVEE